MRHLHYTHNLAGDPPPPVDKSSWAVQAPRLLLLPLWETCGLVLVCPILSVCTFRQRYSS